MAGNATPTYEQSAAGRKLLTAYTLRLKTLSDSLSKPEFMKHLSDGELLRRKDLVDNMKLDRDNFSDALSSKPVSVAAHRFVSNFYLHFLFCRRELFNDGNGGSYSRSQSRVFGVPLETEETKNLDNRGILEVRDNKMKLLWTYLL